jgi:hypothetical protein
MSAPRAKPFQLRPCRLAFGLLVVLTLSACGAGLQSALDDPDDCGPAPCDTPGRMAKQVQLDTDAILAGMAHARARLGVQENAAP